MKKIRKFKDEHTRRDPKKKVKVQVTKKKKLSPIKWNKQDTIKAYFEEE